MRKLTVFVVLIAFLAAASAACSKSNPAGPTASGAGATIHGAITADGSGTANVPGLTVKVTGTSLTATVGANNQFTLRDVPSGDVQLTFAAPSVSGSVGLTAVQAAETVDLTLVISGSTVNLDSCNRERGGEGELEGRVEALPPTTPAGTFTVAGRQVTTNSSTRFTFRDESPATFADLAIGQRVHVRGLRSGDTLTAAIVKIQNTQTDLPFELHGIVQGLTGTAAAFQFTLGDRTVKGDSFTEFHGGSRFADLANDKRVEVKGELRDGFVYARRIHVEEEDDDEAEVEGKLTSKTGTAPNLTLIVDGRTVRTNSATIVRRGSTVLDFSALVVGQELEVDGTPQTDGSILARKIQIEGETDAEARGTLTSKTGTSPTFILLVGSTTVHTNAETEVRRHGDRVGLSALAVGQVLDVEGWRQADGSIVAKRIKIED